MLTSPLLPKDINDAYDLGANSYLIKPPNFVTLVSLAQTIADYWLRTILTPYPIRPAVTQSIPIVQILNQIFNLLYRRIALCGATKMPNPGAS